MVSGKSSLTKTPFCGWVDKMYIEGVLSPRGNRGEGFVIYSDFNYNI